MSKQREQKERLDRLLVIRGFAESRERAQALILAGQVLVNGQKKVKAGSFVPQNASIRILGDQMPYVSRGGLKLAAALREFSVPVRDRVCIDVGASTGGFTDCLLQHGARKVFAVDVGYGQMAWRIRQDPRVIAIERTNIRDLDPSRVQEKAELAVVDVSFISLEKVVPAVMPLLASGAEIIALIKPQFEVGRERVGKGGIVREEADRESARDRIAAFFVRQGFRVHGTMPSPITGQDGNVEYLLYGRLGSTPASD